MIKTKIQKIITKILVAWRQKKSKQNSRKQQKFKNQLNTTHIHKKTKPECRRRHCNLYIRMFQ